MLTAPASRRAVAVLAATLLGITATLRLGFWQVERATQKDQAEATLVARAALPAVGSADLARDAAEADAQRYRQVRLRGRWLAERTVFLDNRQMNGRVGFFVVTPLLLEPAAVTGDAVLVQRGWTPRSMQDRGALPELATPAGIVVEVEGRIAPPPARLYEFDAAGAGAIRQNLDVGRFALETGLALRPLSVQQSGDAAGDGLARQWPRAAVDVHKHHGYAFQWFALAALMAGLYVWFQLLRPRRRGAA